MAKMPTKTYRLPPELTAALEIEAREQGRTPSGMLRRILETRYEYRPVMPKEKSTAHENKA